MTLLVQLLPLCSLLSFLSSSHRLAPVQAGRCLCLLSLLPCGLLPVLRGGHSDLSCPPQRPELPTATHRGQGCLALPQQGLEHMPPALCAGQTLPACYGHTPAHPPMGCAAQCCSSSSLPVKQTGGSRPSCLEQKLDRVCACAKEELACLPEEDTVFTTVEQRKGAPWGN